MRDEERESVNIRTERVRYVLNVTYARLLPLAAGARALPHAHRANAGLCSHAVGNRLRDLLVIV
jgi:hypothetical protein